MLSVTARRPAVSLSPRELEVLELLADGHAPKEIAARIELSVHTVRHHIESARRRYNAGSTPALTAAFVRARRRAGEEPRTS